MMRALLPADAAAVLPVIHAAFAAQPTATNPPSSALRETAASIAARLAAGGGVGVLRDGRWVAVLLWEQEGGETLHLGRLAVLPVERGRGLGRALMLESLAEARRRGLTRVTLGVRVALDGNRRLFESCGFVEYGREAHAGYAVPTTILMDQWVG